MKGLRRSGWWRAVVPGCGQERERGVVGPEEEKMKGEMKKQMGGEEIKRRGCMSVSQGEIKKKLSISFSFILLIQLIHSFISI